MALEQGPVQPPPGDAGAVQRTPGSFAGRILGALRLDGSVFEDVENDPGAMGQATLLVIAAGLARGVGALPEEGVWALVGSPLVAIATWLGGSVLIWGIGVKRFEYTSDYPELLRTLGFAAPPLLFLVLCALPIGVVALWVWFVAHAWATLVMVVAVREALDVTGIRALIVCALAFGVTLMLLFVVGLLFMG
jgi:hypothetical protein